MFAIVDTGGRQEKVQPGAVVLVDRVAVEAGAEVTFNKILLVHPESGPAVVGAPYVKGATVTGVVMDEKKGKKIRVFKTKRRKQYRRTMGHRTIFSRVKISAINL